MSTRRGGHPGFMLLEIVIAVGLLVLGMAVIGAQMQDAVIRTVDTDEYARVLSLAESKLAEMDAGLIAELLEAVNSQADLTDPVEGDFTRVFPNYGWQMLVQNTAVEELKLITLRVLYDPERDIEDDFDFEAETVQVKETFYTLRAIPRPLDLKADFGMPEEQVAALDEELLAETGGSVSASQFDPAMFSQLDLDQLLTLMPALMQAFNMEQSDLMSILPSDLQQQLQALLDAQDGGTEGDDAEGDGGSGGSSDSGSDVGGGSSGGSGGDSERGGRGRGSSDRGGRRSASDNTSGDSGADASGDTADDGADSGAGSGGGRGRGGGSRRGGGR